MDFKYPPLEQFPAEYFEQFNGSKTAVGVRPSVKKFARKHSDRLTAAFGFGLHNPIEYEGLTTMGTDEMFDLLLKMGKRKRYTIDWFVKTLDKDEEYCLKLLQDMANTGLIEYEIEHGKTEREYWAPPYLEGQGEWANENMERLKAHPELSEFFSHSSWMAPSELVQMMGPGGGGVGMHVIPVEKAIEGNAKSVSIEHLSHWLEKYDDEYCLVPCSCRQSRRIRGEGSPEDVNWCILVGPLVQYAIDTKKAVRRLTKEEVLEILQKAEDNGFVHQVSNQDGADKIFVICNCNVESCYALRLSQYFNTPNMNATPYRARVNKEKCVACGQCVEVCPAGAAKLGQKLCTKDGEIEYPVVDLPDNNRWGKDRWDPNYRDNVKKQVYDTGTAPCKTACPAHIGIQGYLKLASQGRYEEALELIKKDNPFPAVCGRVCNRRCEDACTRGNIDNPIAIDEVKNFIALRDINAETRFIPKKVTGNVHNGEKYDQKIAIIGAGPAGLTCAYYLALWGYKPTVFEKSSNPGGMLRYGIPAFKLEKDVIDAEIEVIKALGVEIRCGVEIGKDLTISQLREEGYEAFYLAIGCQGGRNAGIPGEDANGVFMAVDFLHEVSENSEYKVSGRSIVIGGGNVAIDVARTAVRCGSDSVRMFSLEQRDEMPAADEEILEAEEESIIIENGWGPKEILKENGKVTGIVMKRCISVFDDAHHFHPYYDEEDTITLECENVFLSIGQTVQWGDILKDENVELDRAGRVIADPKTYQSSQPDIFAGGDVYTGPKFVIDAIAAARFGADSLRRYVQFGVNMKIGRDWREMKELDKDNLVISPEYDKTPRQVAGVKDTNASHLSFKDNKAPFTEEQVKKETARCLSCGATVIDEHKCIGCGLCTTRCKFDAISFNNIYPENSNMIPFEDRFKAAVPYQIKRMGKIAVHDVEKAIIKLKK